MAYEGALRSGRRAASAGYRDQPIRRWAVISSRSTSSCCVAALALGRERLDALIALAVGTVFALAVVLRARGQPRSSEPRSTPPDEEDRP